MASPGRTTVEAEAAQGLVLGEDELVKLTGYRQPVKQLAVLHQRGFWRAYRSVLGSVVLERAHYTAVCQGSEAKPSAQRKRPQLRLA